MAARALLFVAYADLAITASVLTYSDAEYALFGTLLFGVVGAYASHFVRPVACAVHVVFTSAVVVAIGVVMIRSGDHDVAGTIARVATALLAVNGTVALHALYTADVRQSIARTFASATTDSLTGIGNRQAFEQRAHRLIASGVEVVVVLLDVDDFKLINDTVGHGGEMRRSSAWRGRWTWCWDLTPSSRASEATSSRRPCPQRR